MTIDVYNVAGKAIKKIKLPKKIFELKPNTNLITQSIRVYLSNQRQKGVAKTKSRGLIIGSTRKIYKQKGTGRARHGDRKAPIFVGGAKAHGPRGNQNYKLKLGKKMRRLALFGILSLKLKEKKLIIVSGFENIKPKTKDFNLVLKKLKLLNKKNKLNTKILIVLPKVEQNLLRAGRNIFKLNFAQAKLLNTYQVLLAEKVIFLEDSIKVLQETYFGKKTDENK